MIRRTLRGVAALAALTALLAGWPAALFAAGRAAAGWLPDLSDPLALLAGPDAGGLFLLLVLALGWAAWATWTTAVLVEAAAQIRGVPTPRLGGLFPQHSAAALVTAIAVALTAGPGPALADPSVPEPPPAAAQLAAAADADGPGTPAGTEEAGPGQQEAEDDGVRDYIVARGDTMWDIAGDELADPQRWPEIADASHDIPQPDGRTLTDPDLILPGWTLHIPAPAADPEPAPAETPPPAADPGTTTGSGTAPPSEPALPSTPLQTPRPGAAETPSAGADAEPDDRPVAEGPAAGATVPLPVTPLRPPAAAAGAAGLPATPMAAGREDAPPACWAIDDEGRAGPGHGVLGLPDWITDPLTPTSPADAPDLAAALAATP